MSRRKRPTMEDLGIDPARATVRQVRAPKPKDPLLLDAVPGADRLPRYEVEVPGWRPPTLNKLMRGTLRARMRIEADCARKVSDACRAHRVAPAEVRRRVSLVVALGPGDREFDRDAPYKALLDGLVRCGALTTDRVAGVELGYLNFHRSATRGTTIILEDHP